MEKNTKKIIYFLNFVEEGIFNEDYIKLNYVGGRMEVITDDSPYSIDEIRFLTNKEFWYQFRDTWDFKKVDEKTLAMVTQIIKTEYYQPIR